MVKVGAALVMVGVGAFTAYVLFTMFRVLYTVADVPLVLKVAIPVAVAGLALLVTAVARDRARDRGREKFEEVEH